MGMGMGIGHSKGTFTSKNSRAKAHAQNSRDKDNFLSLPSPSSPLVSGKYLATVSPLGRSQGHVPTRQKGIYLLCCQLPELLGQRHQQIL